MASLGELRSDEHALRTEEHEQRGVGGSRHAAGGEVGDGQASLARDPGVAEVDESKKRGKMKGALSIHGIEKPVVLDVAYLGEATDPWGNTSAAFTAEVNINRKDFGLNWNQTLETGGFLVGDEVQIRIDAAAMPAE